MLSNHLLLCNCKSLLTVELSMLSNHLLLCMCRSGKREVAVNPCRLVPPMEPLDRSVSLAARKPGTPALPFGNVHPAHRQQGL
jgi:hypothetical protein